MPPTCTCCNSFLNVDPARRGSKANQQVLGVIFGPSIPKNFRPYLLPAVRDFNLYSSPDRGIQVGPEDSCCCLAVLACVAAHPGRWIATLTHTRCV